MKTKKTKKCSSAMTLDTDDEDRKLNNSSVCRVPEVASI